MGKDYAPRGEPATLYEDKYNIDFNLLTEDGDDLLAENGNYLLQEFIDDTTTYQNKYLN